MQWCSPGALLAGVSLPSPWILLLVAAVINMLKIIPLLSSFILLVVIHDVHMASVEARMSW